MKKISSTKELNENEVLRVYKQGFGYAVLRVVHIDDDFFSARGDKPFVSALKKKDRLEAYLWSEKLSAYEFELEVLGTIDDDLHMVFFKHADRMRFSRERKCLTADVHLPFSFFPFDILHTRKAFTATAVKKNRGVIVRISDREGVMRYDGSMTEGKFIKGRLKILNEEIDIVAKIEPAPRAEENTYMLKFIGMPERERERILEFVFNVYRE